MTTINTNTSTMTSTTEMMMREIIQLEIELGIHRNFQYSDDIPTRMSQMKQSLRSLKYIKKMRADVAIRMEHFNKPMFPPNWFKFLRNNARDSEEEMEDEVEKVQINGYNKI